MSAFGGGSGGGGDAKVRVRFEPAAGTPEELRLSDAPFVLPQKLGRYGLSEVINHLLQQQGPQQQPQPFDFSVQGTLLRTQLRTFIASNKVSLEEVLTIEYMPALSLSEETQTVEAPAWIGCLSTDVVVNTVVAGCYDGTIQLASTASLLGTGAAPKGGLVSIQAHDDPIRAIACWQRGAGQSSAYFLATASKDLSLKCWSVQPFSAPSSSSSSAKAAKSAPAAHQVASLTGHINSVESVAHWAQQSVLLSGDWAGNIFGWNVEKLGQQQQQGDGGEQHTSKKKKTAERGEAVASVVDIKSAFTVRAHSQSVSGIAVGPGARVFSCSWDHSLKEWDMERQDCVSTYVSGSKVMTSLSFCERSNAVVTSHPDGRVRLWDMRSQSSDGENHCRSVYSVSTGGQWVAQVSWHPTLDNVFASCDYAGIVRVWDVRATSPLGSSEAHDGKALSLGWLQGQGQGQDQGQGQGQTKVVSGGSDCLLSATAFG